MIKLNNKSKITEIPQNNKADNKTSASKNTTTSSATRPKVVDAKVYKVKSAFVKNSVFITLSYVDTDLGRRPIEIFINSKDLNRAPEYVVLTRLISAIFRRATDPMFILEELHGIHDPNGGSFKEGKYYHSFYAEIADVIERFFFDVGIMESPNTHIEKDNSVTNTTKNEVNVANSEFRICNECNNRTLKTENGCDICMSPECGYSKCDK